MESKIVWQNAGEPAHAYRAGLNDGTTRGGHFLKGIVRPTMEVTIIETTARLRRCKRPELGLALIDLSR